MANITISHKTEEVVHNIVRRYINSSLLHRAIRMSSPHSVIKMVYISPTSRSVCHPKMVQW